MNKFSLPLLLACCIWFSCKKVEYTELAGKAQGTTFSIKYQDDYKRNLSSSIDSIFRLIDHSMSLWDSTSIISRVNRNEPGVIVDDHFENVFQKSIEVSNITGGAFDVTVGPLVKAWGFSTKKGLPPPDSLQVDSLKAVVGYQKIELKHDSIIKEDPRVEIDFNAIAQGYTVDVISVFLEEKDIQNYLI
ncbi:MAG TPA: FAD:protein FMN transferase, partial [Saprospiraceae bacterium]|nr:FAD:protein FMN transferase [Saprospiraceae bacterium]